MTDAIRELAERFSIQETRELVWFDKEGKPCSWVDCLSDAIRSLVDEAAPKWRPIETCPLGWVVLLCDYKGNRVSDVFDIDTFFMHFGTQATHWMPLPPLPIKEPETGVNNAS